MCWGCLSFYINLSNKKIENKNLLQLLDWGDEIEMERRNKDGEIEAMGLRWRDKLREKKRYHGCMSFHPGNYKSSLEIYNFLQYFIQTRILFYF